MEITNIHAVLNTTTADHKVGVKLARLTGDTNATVFAIELAPGQCIPAHYHKVGIETYCIIQGEGIIHLGQLLKGQLSWKEKTTVVEGDCFAIEPYQVHQFENNSNHNLRLIGTAPLSHATDEDRFFV